MADTNRVTVSYVAETTWGEKPTEKFQALPITGGSMTHGQDTTRSAVLRSDAQQSDTMRTGISPTASYDFEVAAGQLDGLMQNAVRSAAWSTALSISANTIACVAGTPRTITDSASGLGAVTAGQWIYISGFGGTALQQAANNGWHRVTAKAAGTLTIAGTGLLAQAATDTVTIKGAYITNGTELPSWSIQQHFGDLGEERTLLTGAMIESFGMDISNSAIITANASFTGKEMTQITAEAGDEAVEAATSKEVLSEVDDFGNFWLDDNRQTFDVMSMSWNSSSATRPAKALGSVANTQMNQNALDVTGSIELYLNDDTWGQVANYLAGTKFRLSFSLSEAAGDQYLFDFPSVLYTAEPGTLGGVDSDVMASLDFSAEPGTFVGTTEKTVQIARVVVA